MRRGLIVFLLALLASPCLLAQQTQEQMASYYFSQGAYEQAVELYESLYKSAANKFNYQMLLRSYTELGEYKKAESLINKRIKQYSADLTLRVDLGVLYTRKGDSKKARRAFEEAVEQVKVDAKQASELAMAFESADQPDYAIRTYQRLRDNTKNRYLYVPEMAALYGRKGNYEGMVREYFDLLDHSPRSMSSIQVSLQRMMHDGDEERVSEALRNILMERIQTQPNNVQNVDMMIWFTLQQRDFEFALSQAIAMDRRFPDQQAEAVWRVTQVARSNGDLSVARDGYAYLVKKGTQHPYYMESRVGELQVMFEQYSRQMSDKAAATQLIERYESAIAELGKTPATVPLLRNYANLLAYHADNMQAAADILSDVLEMDQLKPQVRDEVKMDYGDLLLVAGDVWEASLIYMQVEKANKNDVLGSQAKFRNAKLSYYHHDFEWAKSQLDVLRSSTSKLIANDAMEMSLLISDNMEQDSTFDMLEIFADADLLLYRNLLDSAWLRYDEIEHRTLSHPLLDDVLMRKAQIRIKQERYVDADTLLGQLYAFYPDGMLADDALFMRAQLAEEKLQQPDKAKGYYETLLTDFPSSIYIDQVRKRYNEIKKH